MKSKFLLFGILALLAAVPILVLTNGQNQRNPASILGKDSCIALLAEIARSELFLTPADRAILNKLRSKFPTFFNFTTNGRISEFSEKLNKVLLDEFHTKFKTLNSNQQDELLRQLSALKIKELNKANESMSRSLNLRRTVKKLAEELHEDYKSYPQLRVEIWKKLDGVFEKVLNPNLAKRSDYLNKHSFGAQYDFMHKSLTKKEMNQVIDEMGPAPRDAMISLINKKHIIKMKGGTDDMPQYKLSWNIYDSDLQKYNEYRLGLSVDHSWVPPHSAIASNLEAMMKWSEVTQPFISDLSLASTLSRADFIDIKMLSVTDQVAYREKLYDLIPLEITSLGLSAFIYFALAEEMVKEEFNVQ